MERFWYHSQVTKRYNQHFKVEPNGSKLSLGFCVFSVTRSWMIVSGLVGLSAHTFRYYGKIGLLNNVQRNSSRHRVYSAKDVKWLEFVIRLKETAMPVEEILEYARLRDQGSSTVLERQALLVQHQQSLELLFLCAEVSHFVFSSQGCYRSDEGTYKN